MKQRLTYSQIRALKSEPVLMQKESVFNVCPPPPNSSISAFTLAEVLITLGIIGIIAALTLPSLIAKHQEKETVVRLKKINSLLQNNFTKTVFENGTPDTWYLTDEYQDSQKLFEYIFKDFKIDKVCQRYVDRTCWAKEGTKFLWNDTIELLGVWDDRIRFILNDGSTVAIKSIYNDSEKTYGFIYIDVNGKKKPNTWGKDTFTFDIYKDGIRPVSFDDEMFKNECMDNSGAQCAAWAIYNENMDYLKCKNLSWDDPTKCK